MAGAQSSVLILAGLAVGGVLFLAHRASQETGKNLAESLADVLAEAQQLFTDLRSRTEDALNRGREAYYQKQADIEGQLEDISQA
jgi:hypothetical protein